MRKAKTLQCGLAVAAMLLIWAVGPLERAGANDAAAAAQRSGASAEFMRPKGIPRTIDFVTDEGTHMSVDVSPDGSWITFDLLGHIYRLPVRGGRAQCLTAGSGIALNYHPRFSPDGRHIAFISDRSGQANVWVMEMDGSTPRPVFLDDEHRYASPVWSRDGQALLATRFAPTPGQGWHRRNASAWVLPLRGVPKPLLISTEAQYYVSSASPDGHTFYIYASSMARSGASIYETGFRVQSLDLKTGRATDVVTGASAERDAPAPTRSSGAGPQLAYDSSGMLGKSADIAPVASPDGRYLAFARAQDDGLFSFRGHAYRHRTVLYVRDLESGEERKVLDPITKDLTNAHAHYSEMFLPGYAWSPDSREIFISAGGKLVRVDVASTKVSEVPFEAQVHRVISEQVRRTAGFDRDDAVPVRFIQWPTASPDGRQLAFVALGRLWLMELPDGRPTPVIADASADIQFTPAWSPDGSQLAFATWNARTRGQLWSLDVATGRLSPISSEPGEYIWPTWSPDGTLVALRGPGAEDSREAWQAITGWEVIRLGGASPARVLSRGGTPSQPLQVGTDGRVYFTTEWGGGVTARTDLPYPDAAAYELGAWQLMSVDAAGGSPRVHLSFPAAPRNESVPVVSADARWVAYRSDYQIFAERIELDDRSATPTYIDQNPNHPRPSRKRADVSGGTYARWRDEQTLEFASGNEYVTFDVVTGMRSVVPVRMQFSRDRYPGTVALTDARIISMDGDRVIPKGSVLVRDGRIVCVGKCSTQGADRLLNLAGKTIIPGLIDVHDHIATEQSGVVPLSRPGSLLTLAYGVTTIVDPAVPSTSLFPLAEMTDAGRVLGPRVLGSADAVFGSVGGIEGSESASFGQLLAVKSRADAEYQVGRRAAWGAVTIKNFRQTSRQQHQWIIEAARKHGVSVTAEGGPLAFDIGMIMDGQTGWEHFIPALPLYKDASQFLGRAGATYSPTVSVAGFPDGAMFYYRPRFNLQKDPKYLRFASPRRLKAVTPSDAPPPSIEQASFPIQAEGVADIVRAGGYATIGEHGENPGIGSHWEMWAYATALTPLEVLRMATMHGARFVGVEREVGSVSVGKLADLIVLNSNPLERIENTLDMAYVMKSGYLYEAATLNPVWPASPAPEGR